MSLDHVRAALWNTRTELLGRSQDLDRERDELEKKVADNRRESQSLRTRADYMRVAAERLGEVS